MKTNLTCPSCNTHLSVTSNSKVLEKNLLAIMEITHCTNCKIVHFAEIHYETRREVIYEYSKPSKKGK